MHRSHRYGSATAIKAARITPKTLNNWLSRDPPAVYLNEAERREVGERKRFCFSEKRILQIALTAELVTLGVQPRRASFAAMMFTDTDMLIGLDGRLQNRSDEGALASSRYTLLVVPPEPGSPMVMASELSTTIEAVLDQQVQAPFDSAIIIRVEKIVDRVRAVLATAEPLT